MYGEGHMQSVQNHADCRVRDPIWHYGPPWICATPH